MLASMHSRLALLTALALAATACTNPDSSTSATGEVAVPGSVEDAQPFHQIAPDEVIRFVGTEPFWGGRVAGDRLIWSTPENIDGQEIVVTRFAGRGGLSFSGMLDGQQFDMAVSPADCSDGMSDARYPYAASVMLGERNLSGCAYTDRQGRTGGE